MLAAMHAEMILRELGLPENGGRRRLPLRSVRSFIGRKEKKRV